MPIRDPGILKSIDPIRVASYLQTKGWRQESCVPGKVSIWTLGNDPESQAEIFLPLNQDFQDFAIRMSEVLKTLEAVEHRSQSEIVSLLVD